MQKLILVSDNKVVHTTLYGDSATQATAIRNFLQSNIPQEVMVIVANEHHQDVEQDKNYWTKEDKIDDHFSTIRAAFTLMLTPGEIDAVTNNLGYAFRQVIRGEQLSNVRVIQGNPYTILEWDYDTTKTRSDDPDFQQLIDLAKLYIVEGSPIRKTNHSGEGTKGTRLVEGIGSAGEDVCFWVK